MRKKLNLAAVLSIVVGIAYLSLRSTSGSAVGTSTNGYILHSIAYFALAAALITYFQDTQRGHFEAVLVATAFGFLIELIQMTLSYRYFGVYDALANLAGASLILLDSRSVVVSKVVETEDRILSTVSSIIF